MLTCQYELSGAEQQNWMRLIALNKSCSKLEISGEYALVKATHWHQFVANFSRSPTIIFEVGKRQLLAAKKLDKDLCVISAAKNNNKNRSA